MDRRTLIPRSLFVLLLFVKLDIIEMKNETRQSMTTEKTFESYTGDAVSDVHNAGIKSTTEQLHEAATITSNVSTTPSSAESNFNANSSNLSVVSTYFQRMRETTKTRILRNASTYDTRNVIPTKDTVEIYTVSRKDDLNETPKHKTSSLATNQVNWMSFASTEVSSSKLSNNKTTIDRDKSDVQYTTPSLNWNRNSTTDQRWSDHTPHEETNEIISSPEVTTLELFNANKTTKYISQGVLSSTIYSPSGVYEGTNVFSTARSKQSAIKYSKGRTTIDGTKAEQLPMTSEELSPNFFYDSSMNVSEDINLSEEMESRFDDITQINSFPKVSQSSILKKLTRKTDKNNNNSTLNGTDLITKGYPFNVVESNTENSLNSQFSSFHEHRETDSLDIFDRQVTSTSYVYNNKKMSSHRETQNFFKTSGKTTVAPTSPYINYNFILSQTESHGSASLRNNGTTQPFNFESRRHELAGTSVKELKPQFTLGRDDATYPLFEITPTATTTHNVTKKEKHSSMHTETISSGFREENIQEKIKMSTTWDNANIADTTNSLHSASSTVTSEDKKEYLSTEMKLYTNSFKTKSRFQEDKRPRFDQLLYTNPLNQSKTTVDYIFNYSTVVSREIISEDPATFGNASKDAKITTVHPIDIINTYTYKDYVTQMRTTANTTAYEQRTNITPTGTYETFSDEIEQKPQTIVTDTIEGLQAGDMHGVTDSRKPTEEDNKKTAYEISNIIDSLNENTTRRAATGSTKKQMYLAHDNITVSLYTSPPYELKEKQVVIDNNMQVTKGRALVNVTTYTTSGQRTSETMPIFDKKEVEVKPEVDYVSNVTLGHAVNRTISDVTLIKALNSKGSAMSGSLLKTKSYKANITDDYNYKKYTTNNARTFMSNNGTNKPEFLNNSGLTKYMNNLYDDVEEKTKTNTKVAHMETSLRTSLANCSITTKYNTSNTSPSMTTAREVLMLQKSALLEEKVPNTRVSRSAEVNDESINGSVVLINDVLKETGLVNTTDDSVSNEDLTMFTKAPILTRNVKSKSVDPIGTPTDNNKKDGINVLVTTTYKNVTQFNTTDRKLVNNAETGLYPNLYLQSSFPSYKGDTIDLIFSKSYPNSSMSRNSYTLTTSTESFLGEITSFDQILDTANKTERNAINTTPKSQPGAVGIKQSSGCPKEQSIYLAPTTHNSVQLDALKNTSTSNKPAKRFATTTLKHLMSTKDSHTFSDVKVTSLKRSTTQESSLTHQNESLSGQEPSLENVSNVWLHENTLSYLPDLTKKGDVDLSKQHELTHNNQQRSKLGTVGNTAETKFTNPVGNTYHPKTTVTIPIENLFKEQPSGSETMPMEEFLGRIQPLMENVNSDETIVPHNEMLKTTYILDKIYNPITAKVTDSNSTSLSTTPTPVTHQSFTRTKLLRFDSNKPMAEPKHRTTRTTVNNVSFDSTVDFIDNSSIRTSQTTHSEIHENTDQPNSQSGQTSKQLGMDTARNLLNHYPSTNVMKFDSGFSSETDQFKTANIGKTTQYLSIAKSEVDKQNVTSIKLTTKPNQTTHTAITTRPKSTSTVYYRLITIWSLRPAEVSSSTKPFSQHTTNVSQYPSILLNRTNTHYPFASNKEAEVQQHNKSVSMENLSATTPGRENGAEGRFSDNANHVVDRLSTKLMFSSNSGKHDTVSVSNVPEKPPSHLKKSSTQTEEPQIPKILAETENVSLRNMNATTNVRNATNTRLPTDFITFTLGKDEDIYSSTDSIFTAAGKQTEKPARIQPWQFHINFTESPTAALDPSSKVDVYQGAISMKDQVGYYGTKPSTVSYTKSSLTSLKENDSSSVDTISSQPVHSTIFDRVYTSHYSLFRLKEISSRVANGSNVAENTTPEQEFFSQKIDVDEEKQTNNVTKVPNTTLSFNENLSIQKEAVESNVNQIAENLYPLLNNTNMRVISTVTSQYESVKMTEINEKTSPSFIGSSSDKSLALFSDDHLYGGFTNKSHKAMEVFLTDRNESNETEPTESNFSRIVENTSNIKIKPRNWNSFSTGQLTTKYIKVFHESTDPETQFPDYGEFTTSDHTRIRDEKLQSEITGKDNVGISTNEILSKGDLNTISKAPPTSTKHERLHETAISLEISINERTRDESPQIPTTSSFFENLADTGMNTADASNNSVPPNFAISATQLNAVDGFDQPVSYSPSDRTINMSIETADKGSSLNLEKDTATPNTRISSSFPSIKTFEMTNTLDPNSYINKPKSQSGLISNVPESLGIIDSGITSVTHMPKAYASTIKGNVETEMLVSEDVITDVGDRQSYETTAYDFTAVPVKFSDGEKSQKPSKVMDKDDNLRLNFTKPVTFDVTSAATNFMSRQNYLEPQSSENHTIEQFPLTNSIDVLPTESSNIQMLYSTKISNPDNDKNVNLSDTTVNHTSHSHNNDKTKLQKVSSSSTTDYFSENGYLGTASAKEHNLKEMYKTIFSPITFSARRNEEVPIKFDTDLSTQIDWRSKAFYSHTRKIDINAVNPKLTNYELTENPYSATETFIYMNYKRMPNDVVETSTVAQDNQYISSTVLVSPDDGKLTKFTDISSPFRRFQFYQSPMTSPPTRSSSHRLLSYDKTTNKIIPSLDHIGMNSFLNNSPRTQTASTLSTHPWKILQTSVQSIDTSSSGIKPQIYDTLDNRNSTTSTIGVTGRRLEVDKHTPSAGIILDANETFSSKPTPKPLYGQSFTNRIVDASLLSKEISESFENKNTASTPKLLFNSQYSNGDLPSVSTELVSSRGNYSVDSNRKYEQKFKGDSTILRYTLPTVYPENLESDSKISSSIETNNTNTNEGADLTKIRSIQMNSSLLPQPHIESKPYSLGIAVTLYENPKNTKPLDDTSRTDISMINHTFHTPSIAKSTEQTSKRLSDVSRSSSPILSSSVFNYSSTKLPFLSPKSYEEEYTLALSEYPGTPPSTDTEMVHQSDHIDDILLTYSKHIQSSTLTDSLLPINIYLTKGDNFLSRSDLTTILPVKTYVTGKAFSSYASDEKVYFPTLKETEEPPVQISNDEPATEQNLAEIINFRNSDVVTTGATELFSSHRHAVKDKESVASTQGHSHLTSSHIPETRTQIRQQTQIVHSSQNTLISEKTLDVEKEKGDKGTVTFSSGSETTPTGLYTDGTMPHSEMDETDNDSNFTFSRKTDVINQTSSRTEFITNTQNQLNHQTVTTDFHSSTTASDKNNSSTETGSDRMKISRLSLNTREPSNLDFFRNISSSTNHKMTDGFLQDNEHTFTEIVSPHDEYNMPEGTIIHEFSTGAAMQTFKIPSVSSRSTPKSGLITYDNSDLESEYMSVRPLSTIPPGMFPITKVMDNTSMHDEPPLKSYSYEEFKTGPVSMASRKPTLSTLDAVYLSNSSGQFTATKFPQLDEDMPFETKSSSSLLIDSSKDTSSSMFKNDLKVLTDASLVNLNDSRYSSTDISFIDIYYKLSTPTDISFKENQIGTPSLSVTDLFSFPTQDFEFGKDHNTVPNDFEAQTRTTDTVNDSLKVEIHSSSDVDSYDVSSQFFSSLPVSAAFNSKKGYILPHTTVRKGTGKRKTDGLDQVTHWIHTTENQTNSEADYTEKFQVNKGGYIDGTEGRTNPPHNYSNLTATIFPPEVPDESQDPRSLPAKKYTMSSVFSYLTTVPSYKTTFANNSVSGSLRSRLDSTQQENPFNMYETSTFTHSSKSTASNTKVLKMSEGQHSPTLPTSPGFLILDTLPKSESETRFSNTVSGTKNLVTTSNTPAFPLAVPSSSSTVPTTKTDFISVSESFSVQPSKHQLKAETGIFSSVAEIAKIQLPRTSSLHPLTIKVITSGKEKFSSNGSIEGLRTSEIEIPYSSTQTAGKTPMIKRNVSFSGSLSTEEAPATLVTDLLSLSRNSQSLDLTTKSEILESSSNALATKPPPKLETEMFLSGALNQETPIRTKILLNAAATPTSKTETSSSNMLTTENNLTLGEDSKNTSSKSLKTENQPASFFSSLSSENILVSTIETLPSKSPSLGTFLTSETWTPEPNTLTEVLSGRYFPSLIAETTGTPSTQSNPEILSSDLTKLISGTSNFFSNTQKANTHTLETEKSSLNAHTAEILSTSAAKLSSANVPEDSSLKKPSTVTYSFWASYTPVRSSSRETTHYSSEYLEETKHSTINWTTEPAQDTDECREEGDICPTESTCVNIDDGYTCLCNEGYQRLDLICIDVNECLEENSCPINAECINTRGSFRCECTYGFTMVGSQCQDLDECAGSSPCPWNALCENVDGGYLCNCNHGYRSVASECKDINECEDAVCGDHAVCENSEGSYKCLCPNGYGLSAHSDCTDIDECMNSLCGENSVCENTQGSYMCGCLEGYSEDESVNCIDIDECVNNPCPRSSDCINVPGSFICSCHHGYYLQEDSFSCLESKLFTASIRAINFNDSEIILSELTSMELSLVVDAILDAVGSSLNKEYTVVNVLNVTSISEGSVIVNLTLYLAANSTYSSDQLYSLMKDDPSVWTMNLLNVDSIIIEDVDECSDPELNRCSQFADCLNTPGSYECKCLVGYIDMSNDRSGQHCAMIDENHQDIIKNLTLIPNRRAYPVGTMATICVTMERGSHVTFHVQFGDGIEETIVLHDILSFRYAVNITHQYNSTGNFTVTLTASNNVSLVTTADVIVVQKMLHSLTLETDDLDSLYTGEKKFTVTSAELFNNVHIAIDFGDTAVQILYLDHLDGQFTFNHSYNVGHTVMVANISNMVGWIKLEADVSAVELISGVETLLVDKVKQPGHTVQIVVFTATGSGIVLDINYGNGQQDEINKQNKRGPTETVLSIAYASPGEYLVNITLFNNKSSWNELVGPTFIQNPVKMLNILIDPITPIPPGLVNLDVTFTQKLSPPTAVTCDMTVNGLFRNSGYSAELAKGDFLHVEVEVHDPDISGWADVRLNCSNMISSQYIETGTYIQHRIQNISINMDKLFIPVGENVEVEFWIQKGSHIKYAYNFDSESNKTGTLAKDIFNNTRINDSYIFGHPGLRIVSFYVRNSVSERSTSASIWVLQNVKGLTVDRYYEQSSVNSLISYGHGNEGNIFPLQRPVIFNTSLLTGNNVQYDWNFGDGNVTSTYTSAIHHTYKHNGNFTVEATAFNQLYSESRTLNIIIFDIVLPFRLSNNGPKKSHLPILFTLELTYVGTMSCFIWDMGDNSTILMYGGANCPTEADDNNLNYTTFKERVVSQTMLHSHTYQHEGIYEASVITFNSVSVTSIEGKAIVSGISCFYPEVSFIGGRKIIDKPIKKLRSDWITLETTAVINCETSNIPLYHWSVQKVSQGQTYLEYNLDPYDTNIATVDMLKIFFLPQSLDIGLYKVSINVSMFDVAGLYTVEYTYLEISATPLVISIKGGTARCVSYNSNLRLDGLSGSYDPDGSKNLTYEWWCRQEHESFNYLTDKTELEVPSSEYNYNSPGSGGCFGTGIGRLPYREGLIELSTVLLEPNSGNIFLLIVSEGSRQARFEQTVHVVEGDPPAIQIECIKNCKSKMNPSSELSLASSCEDCYGEFSVQHLWSLYVEHNGQFSQLELLPLISTEVEDTGIVFRPKVLEGGKTYKVRLDVTLYGHTPAFTEYTFVTNLPPYGGNCSISPETGYALDTLFTIQCQGWLIPGEEGLQGEGLLYRFWTQVRGGSDLQLLYYGPDPFTAPSKFPLGLQEADYKHDIVVHVSDAIGEYVETQLETKVLPVPKQNLDEVRALAQESSSLLQTMKQAGQDQEYKQLIVAMASVLNVPEETGGFQVSPSTISTSSLNPENDSSIVVDEQQNKEKNTQLRTTIVQQLSETNDVTLDALQQTALAFKVITEKRDELSKESQEAAVDAITRMTAHFKDIIEEPARQQTSKQVILAAEEMLASVGNVVLAARVDVAGKLEKLNEKESLETVQKEELEPPETVGISPENDSIVNETENLQVKKLITKAIDVKDKILGSLAKTRAPGQDLHLQTEAFTIHAKREELGKLEGTVLESDSGKFLLPSSKVIFSNESILTQFIDINFVEYPVNPYVWSTSAKYVNTAVVSLELVDSGGQQLNVTNLSTPIAIDIKLDPRLVKYQHVQAVLHSTTELQHHVFKVRSNYSHVHIIVKPITELTDDHLEVFITHDAVPTVSEYIIKDVLPHPVINIEEINGTLSAIEQSDLIEEELKYTIILSSDVLQQYGTGLWYLGIRKQVNESREVVFNDDLSVYYDNTLDNNPVTFNYSIGFMTTGCYFWDIEEEIWTNTGCQISPLSSSYFTRCLCNHLTSFGADFFVPPNSIQFETVFATMENDLKDNHVVLAVLSCLFLLYIVGLVWARYQDKKDVQRWGVLPLADNILSDSYFYEITVCTGMRHGAGTSSNINFVLAGDHGDTGVRQLRDAKKIKNFSRGSINKFILSVEEGLGPLSCLRVWHDNSGVGKQQGWYLSKVVVQDLQDEEIYVFLCNQWLAVEKEDGMIDRLLSVANRDDLTRFSSLFLSNTKKNLTDSHLWISIFSRPNWSNFSRIQRLSCLFALVMTSMLASAMFYQADKRIENAQGYTLGPVKFTLQELYISIVTNLIVFPINVVIVQLFRKSRPKKVVKNNAFNIHRPMSTLSRFSMTLSGLFRTRTTRTDVSPIPQEDGTIQIEKSNTNTKTRSLKKGFLATFASKSLARYNKECIAKDTYSNQQPVFVASENNGASKPNETPAPAIFGRSSSNCSSQSYFDARHHYSPAPPLFFMKTSSTRNTVKREDNVDYLQNETIKKVHGDPKHLFTEALKSSIKLQARNKTHFPLSTEFFGNTEPECEREPELLSCDQRSLSVSSTVSPNVSPRTKSPSAMSTFSFDSRSSISITQDMESITLQPDDKHNAAKGGITLPHWCVYIAWLLVFLSSAVSAFLTFLYSMEWGKEKSMAWLASMLLSIVESVTIVQPLKILCLAFFVAVILRKPEEELEKEEQNAALYEIQPDEICATQPTGKLIRQTDTSNIKPLDVEQLKKAREKRLKEMKMFRIVQEIIFYLFYLMILLLVATHNRDSNSYRMKQVLMNILSPKQNLTLIYETKHIWEWIDEFLVPGLYPTKHWDSSTIEDERNRLITTHVAYRLGPVRLRQHRVLPELCSLPKEMVLYVHKCSFDYDGDYSSKVHFSEGWAPYQGNKSIYQIYREPWLYKSGNDIDGLPYVGELATYSGGGYISDLIGQRKHITTTLTYLRNNSWIDAYTRVLFIEFTIYNPNINLFTMTQVVLEMATTGIIIPKAHFFTFRLFNYLGAYGIFMIVCELTALVCVVYFVGLELKQVRRQGRSHFRSFWNCFQLCTMMTSIICVVMYLLRHAMTTLAMKKITKLEDKFYNFQRIAAWDDIFQTLLAVSIFFSILKLIHLLRFNRRMSLLARTLKQSGREMAAFSIVLFLFMLAFASCGHLLFGANVYGFSNMLRGFETLTAFSLGSYDFNYLTRNNRFLGPMFFFVYFTFVAFVLINMFVTILNDAVTVVHHDVLKQTNEYEILEFLLSKLKSWLHIDLQKVILDVKRKYVPDLLTGEEIIDMDVKEIEDKLDKISSKLDIMLTSAYYKDNDFNQLFLDSASLQIGI